MATGDDAEADFILAFRCVPGGAIDNLSTGARSGCFDGLAPFYKSRDRFQFGRAYSRWKDLLLGVGLVSWTQ